MAAICAGRCMLSPIRSNPRALYTFGCPRIGTGRYVNYVQLEAYRWVNNNDIVARLPPAWLGYRHKGQEVYINAYGKIRRLTSWQRVKDRWRGFVRGLRDGRFDHFADHSIGRYLQHIRSAVEEEEGLSLRALPLALSDHAPRPVRHGALGGQRSNEERPHVRRMAA
jgi:triacylglycerol lipase